MAIRNIIADGVEMDKKGGKRQGKKVPRSLSHEEEEQMKKLKNDMENLLKGGKLIN